MQKVQDTMLAEVQGRCRAVQGRCREVQGCCTICTSASTISGAGRCRRCRHTSGIMSHECADTAGYVALNVALLQC